MSIFHIQNETDSLSIHRRARYLMTIAVLEHQSSCGRKRRRGATEEEHSIPAATSPQPPWKKARRPIESRPETNTTYWDSLSKLWLTRRALKELNRRNRQTASPVKTGSIRRRGLSGELAALKSCSPPLKRFARHGGPDLCDLRGASSAHGMLRLLLI